MCHPEMLDEIEERYEMPWHHLIIQRTLEDDLKMMLYALEVRRATIIGQMLGDHSEISL